MRRNPRLLADPRDVGIDEFPTCQLAQSPPLAPGAIRDETPGIRGCPAENADRYPPSPSRPTRRRKGHEESRRHRNAPPSQWMVDYNAPEDEFAPLGEAVSIKSTTGSIYEFCHNPFLRRECDPRDSAPVIVRINRSKVSCQFEVFGGS